jgi:hypothetical protein
MPQEESSITALCNARYYARSPEHNRRSLTLVQWDMVMVNSPARGTYTEYRQNMISVQRKMISVQLADSGYTGYWYIGSQRHGHIV